MSDVVTGVESTPIKKPFMPPRVGLGDTVLWRHSADDGSDAAAIVVKVGHLGALGLVVFAPDTVRGLPMDGVLHIDDPRNKGRQSETGVWRHTDRTVRLNKMIEVLADNSDAAGNEFKILVDGLD